MRDDRERLRDILEAFTRIERYAVQGREAFERDELLQTWMVHHLQEEGVAVALLDLTAIGQNLTPEQWYDGLLSHLGERLDLEEELDDFCLDQTRFGPLQRWMRALQEVVLVR